jgi:hypothetical protein
MKFTPTPPDTTCAPDMMSFSTMLHIAYFARDLSETMAFCREGISDINTFRYITAFFSFYFVIEGLYANGKWRLNEVTAEYLKSDPVIPRTRFDQRLSGIEVWTLHDGTVRPSY